MKKKYHVVLTPDEPEIIAFKKSLPQGELSKTVATIMTESLKDKVATIPMSFEIEPVTKDGLFFMICVNTENGIKYRMVIGLVSRKAAYCP